MVKLGVVIMKRFVISTGLACTLFVCSCDKHNVLMAEREKLEAEIKRGQEEQAGIDAKAQRLGIDLGLAQATMQNQNEQWLTKIATLEQQLAALSQKCAEGEEAMKTLRAQLDAYKAKFVR